MLHINEKILRSNYKAFARGDAKPLMASLSEDIQWHVSGRSPLAGDYFGKKQVLEFFGRMMDLYGGTLTLDVIDVLANDKHGVVMTHERAEHRGKRLEFRAIHVWDIEDGKLVQFHVYNDDAYHKHWS
jgi:ketosteroid isomerase-like protein